MTPASIDVVIAAGGSGTRLGADTPKAFVPVAGEPMLGWTLETVAGLGVRRAVVAVPAAGAEAWIDRVAEIAGDGAVAAVAGGHSRQASVRNGLLALQSRARAAGEGPADVVLVHDAARPCASLGLWRRVAEEAGRSRGAVPVLPSSDSLNEVDAGEVVRSIDRSRVMRVQTPQGFDFAALLTAHLAAAESGDEATDDAALFERASRRVVAVPGEEHNIKVTRPGDLQLVARHLRPEAVNAPVRVGLGYDIHPLVSGRRLVLGGLEIEHERGLDGHSDADSLTHAIIDALLGAAGLGDIGQKFPASASRWKDADSLELLARTVADLAAAGYRPLNVDATILAEQPRLLPHLAEMRRRLAERMELPLSCVNVKATRGEGLGSIGRGEGIAAHAVATVGAG